MTFSIHPVDMSDVDALIRQVEYPAHQNNPLHLLMFPGSDKQDEQREEEIQWMIDGLRQTIPEANTTLHKACKEDGFPIGLIGWIAEQKIVRIVEKNEDGIIIPPAELRPKNVRMKKQPDTRCPTTMDVESWLRVSKQLREERQRALRQCRGNGVCRKSPALCWSLLHYSL
jgi:hypothetical protein